MRYAWLVAAILGARFVVTALSFPPGDGDLAWQRWLGRAILATGRIPRTLGTETFSASGAAWTPQEWAFGIAAALGANGVGWTVFSVGVALCAVAGILLTALRASRRGAAPLDVGIVSAAVGLALLDSFGVRAQVVAWPMAGLLLLALDEEGPWMWAAVPIAALWSNLHASAMLAPLLAGAVVAGRLAEDRAWSPRVRQGVMVCVATAAAICCNPFGIGLPLYAVSLFGSPIKHYINEWQATDLTEQAFAFGSLPILLVAAALGIMRGTRRPADALIFAAFTFLLFFAGRNVALFAIAIAPMAAVALTEVAGRDPRPPLTSQDRTALGMLSAMVAVIMLVLGVKLEDSADRTELTMPYHEVAALQADGRPHRVFCADFAWCSYFLDTPRVRVFLDGRADPYPPAVWEDFVSMTFLRPKWRELLHSYGIDAVLVARGTTIDQALAMTGTWRDAAHDAKFRLWVPTEHP